jgi:hypothetical protein
VQTVDPITGQLNTVLPDTGHVLMAAGVSTCDALIFIAASRLAVVIPR